MNSLTENTAGAVAVTTTLERNRSLTTSVNCMPLSAVQSSHNHDDDGERTRTSQSVGPISST